jgi:hypothetical protein
VTFLASRSVAAPPTTVMNSRRLLTSDRRSMH